MGQFVSSYYLSTLIDHIAASCGRLNLHGEVPAWSVSHQVVTDAVKHCVDMLHSLLP